MKVLNDVRERVELALSEIRPFLESDGGNVILVDVEGDCAKVRFEGNCVDCTINHMTLKSGIETTIKKNVPEITRIEQVD